MTIHANPGFGVGCISEVSYVYRMQLNRYNITKSGESAKCFIIPVTISVDTVAFIWSEL